MASKYKWIERYKKLDDDDRQAIVATVADSKDYSIMSFTVRDRRERLRNQFEEFFALEHGIPAEILWRLPNIGRMCDLGAAHFSPPEVTDHRHIRAHTALPLYANSTCRSDTCPSGARSAVCFMGDTAELEGRHGLAGASPVLLHVVPGDGQATYRSGHCIPRVPSYLLRAFLHGCTRYVTYTHTAPFSAQSNVIQHIHYLQRKYKLQRHISVQDGFDRNAIRIITERLYATCPDPLWVPSSIILSVAGTHDCCHVLVQGQSM